MAFNEMSGAAVIVKATMGFAMRCGRQPAWIGSGLAGLYRGWIGEHAAAQVNRRAAAIRQYHPAVWWMWSRGIGICGMRKRGRRIP